ncbi:Hypothetical protein in type-1 retrotransposable element, partial [Stegodyphus mimosarum]
MSKSRVKCMLIVFFYGKGVIHKEFVARGQTVTGDFYARGTESARRSRAIGFSTTTTCPLTRRTPPPKFWSSSTWQHNEEADTLAKSAANDLNRNEIPTKLPASCLKKETLKTLLIKWQDRWTSESTGRRVFSFFPKVSLCQRSLSNHHTQFFSGHGPFNSYLYRFGLSDTDLCTCGMLGDPDHFIFHCELTSNFHMKKPSDQHKTKW